MYATTPNRSRRLRTVILQQNMEILQIQVSRAKCIKFILARSIMEILINSNKKIKNRNIEIKIKEEFNKINVYFNANFKASIIVIIMLMVVFRVNKTNILKGIKKIISILIIMGIIMKKEMDKIIKMFFINLKGISMQTAIRIYNSSPITIVI
jgi:hypothetical protein